jgi:hypothetical protein
MNDYSELKRLAEAATPGPWAGEHDVYSDGGHGERICKMATAEDSAFIAAANPAAVLALIAELEQLQGARKLCHIHGLEECVTCFWPPAQLEDLARLRSENESLLKEQDSWHKYAEETRKAFEEVAELRKDAERYRWLRKPGNTWGDHFDVNALDFWIVGSREEVENPHCDDLDKSVDYFMAKDSAK